MTYDPHKHNRRSIRLKGYDYSQAGAYFVTICIQSGECLLGDIVLGEMVLNWRGHTVAGTWLWLAERYEHVQLGAWQIMPNHLHGIILLTDDVRHDHGVGAVREPPLQHDSTQHGPSGEQSDHLHGPAAWNNNEREQKPKTVGRLVGAFKTVSTAQINRLQETPGARLWQRDFYDRIIRNEREYEAIQTYIYNNPVVWDADRLHPEAPANRFNKGWKAKLDGS